LGFLRKNFRLEFANFKKMLALKKLIYKKRNQEIKSASNLLNKMVILNFSNIFTHVIFLALTKRQKVNVFKI